VLAIEGPDVVLCFLWLQSLGKVSNDYPALIIEFSWEGTTVTLVGDSTLAPHFVSLHQLHALVHSDEIACIFVIIKTNYARIIEPERTPDFPQHLIPPFLELLHHYSHIFFIPCIVGPKERWLLVVMC
jgi:hypothetical protein